MNTPVIGPKAKRSASTVGGAGAIIIGWIVGDLLGYPMPDHVLQAFTILLMLVAERLGDPE